MKLELSAIESDLTRNGAFNLLDRLIDDNVIPFPDYESWRYGRQATLDPAFTVSPQELEEYIVQCESHCRKLELQQERQVLYPWSDNSENPLKISRRPVINEALQLRWLRPQDLPQMDLFMDNAQAVAENELLHCLTAGRFGAAQDSLHRLTGLNASHPRLGAYQDLINYGLHIEAIPDIPAEAVAEELYGLRDEVTPLARDILSTKARDYLARPWRRLAQNLQNQPFNPRQPELHESYALAQVPDWQALETNLSGEAVLFQSPHLLMRLALAYTRNRKPGLSLLTWGLLMERFPDDGETLIDAAGRDVRDRWDDFLAFDDRWPSSHFLGYLLIRQPGLVRLLNEIPQPAMQVIADPVNQATIELIQARLNGENEKEPRARLKALSSSMLRCYMNPDVV